MPNQNQRLNKSTLTLLMAGFLFFPALSKAEVENKISAPEAKISTEKSIAVFAGGCFWCIEKDFDHAAGVTSTVSGYTGGSIKNPTYDSYHDQGEGITPHIEALKIEYDPKATSYEDLLRYYFRHIDPTDGGGQFCDRGPSYRPAIFVQNEQERKQAQAISAETEKLLGKRIAVEIIDASTFWPAEDYHQDYYTRNEIRYSIYRWNCGRDQRVKELWGAPDDKESSKKE